MRLQIILLAMLAAAVVADEEVKIQPIKSNQPISKVDYPGFSQMTKEVESHRSTHLVKVEKFMKMAGEQNTIILDTRSARNYAGRHIAGAVHLNFSEFSEEKLAKLIPDKETRILIYCNNNFKDDPTTMVLKSAPLALNIPTFINLYGYGYKNVYELSDYLSVKDARLEFEGTQVK
ncbi:MAG: rhodanese-like domain-containing protein [Rubritalea sp.]|uniref:rhodanese-like domain-containing protein n=1 Tax=Rubritalea sp. TaxID=2109375 RepID=UPI003242FCF8